MKLESLHYSSRDRLLIRLYDYRVDEIEHLRAACRDLADGCRTEFALHEQPWIDAVDGCEFPWQAGAEDIGVRMPGRGQPFILCYSEEAWREVEGKLDCLLGDLSGFN